MKRTPEQTRRYMLKCRFQMTVEQYDEKLEQQGGGCEICGSTKPHPGPRQKNFSVDHDRRCCPGEKSCGKCVRGLLCQPCNARLGVLENNRWTEKANDYLRRYER